MFDSAKARVTARSKRIDAYAEGKTTQGVDDMGNEVYLFTGVDGRKWMRKVKPRAGSFDRLWRVVTSKTLTRLEMDTNDNTTMHRDM